MLAAVAPLHFPQLLAFPYYREIGDQRVWSEQPLAGPALAPIVAASAARIDRSPVAREREQRRIFLTNGGWRWHWLVLTSRGAFAITRPLSENIVVNRTNLRTGKVSNGRAVGGVRSLASVIAHETAHGMIRRRYGPFAGLFHPNWLIEGYCDFVAGESSLSATEVARLEAAGEDHPALSYFHGRRRVASILARNGGSVDRLVFGEHR